MDPIEPIGLRQLPRVEHATDERERNERQQRERDAGRQPAAGSPQGDEPVEPEGPVEGDDGQLHIDVRA